MINLPLTNFLQHKDMFNNTIKHIDSKERSVSQIKNIIQNASQQGDLNEDFKSLLQHIARGGSLENIEEKFDVEKIEMASQQVTGQASNKYLEVDDEEDLENKSVNILLLLILTLEEKLFSSLETPWKICKDRAKTRILKANKKED